MPGPVGPTGPTGTVAAAGAGTAALPSISFAADPNTGLYNRNPDEIGLSTNGADRWIANTTQFQIGPTLSWGATPGAPDVFLVREAGNTLALRNGVTAQTLRLYNTYTDASNYARVRMSWNGLDFQVMREPLGTGATGNLDLGVTTSNFLTFWTNNTLRWSVRYDGHFVAVGADNTYDIGASGATRPRTIYVGTSVVTSSVGTEAGGTDLNFRANGANRWTISATTGYLQAAADNFYDIAASASGRPRTIYAGTSVVTPLLDTPLLAPTGNAVEQRNGTNSQIFRLYDTYTDAGNYSRLNIFRFNTQFYIQTDAAGTGVRRYLNFDAPYFFFSTATGVVWQIFNNHLITGANNAYDIGDSANANRPRNVFAAGALCTGVKAGAAIDADVILPTDGMLRVDSTNSRLYVRVGGTWRYAALT